MMLLSALKIASQSKSQLVRAYITCPSLLQLGFVSKRINFPLEENQRKGRLDCGLGLFRRYSTLIRVGSGRKFVSKSCTTEVDSVMFNNLFQRLFCSKARHKTKRENYYSRNMKDKPKGNNHKSEFTENPVSKICKVKEELNGGYISYPLLSSMNNAKKGLHVEIEDKEELTDIKEGDIINLRDLLFTENRDYLVKYNGQKVKAEQLGGKSMLIYFIPISLDLSGVMETEYTTCLIDIYNDLLPNNDFEVIVVAVDELRVNYSFPFPELQRQRDPEKIFETMFSRMPWTAIPFSDIASRKRIAKRFGVLRGRFYDTVSFFLDSKGVVLTCNACPYFNLFGTLGYPFTDERIRYLEYEDDEAANQPSLETLLGSPIRDYVISNKEDRVPIQTLKDKVVALYFYEDGLTDDELTIKLKMAYMESAKNKENFEVVLLYLYDTHATLHSTNEESFWKIFKTMPWLALPFKDPNLKKLKRIFDYPDDLFGQEEPPTLVIFGPNGEFVEPCGADILMDFGASARPFTRKRLAKLEAEKIKELKLEMLWDPNTIFRVVKDGLKVRSSGNLLNFENAWSKIRSKLEILWDPITFVRIKHRLQFLPNVCPLLELTIPNIKIPFSQFAGKRLIILFEMDKCHGNSLKLSMIKELYLQKKGTDDEFEVIHIKKPPSDIKFVAYLPWLVHYYGEGYSLPTELERSIFNFQYDHHSMGMKDCLLLAFERDGSIVRKSFYPTFDYNVFPFYAGGLEKELSDQINVVMGWYYCEYLSRQQQIYKCRQ